MINTVSRFVAICSLAIAASQASATLILSDTFSYADSAALRANWPGVNPASPVDFDSSFFFADSASGLISANPAQRPATLTNQTLMGINNRSAYREIGQTVSNDFTLTAFVASNSYSRTLQIGLGDAAGAGYSFSWNAALPTNNSGNGVLNIREATTWTAAAPSHGVALVANRPSPLAPSANMTGQSPATRYALPNPITAGAETPPRINYSPASVFLGYSEVKLTWVSATGLLELYQDGVLKGSVTDTTYNTFSRIYVSGGSRIFVDLITLDVVPEPGSFSLIALSALALTLARRAKI